MPSFLLPNGKCVKVVSWDMAVKIQMENKNFIIIIVYIFPSLGIILLNQICKAVENYIENICNEFSKINVIITDYFNARLGNITEADLIEVDGGDDIDWINNIVMELNISITPYFLMY